MYNLANIGRYKIVGNPRSIGGATQIVEETFSYFKKQNNYNVNKIDLNSLFVSIRKLLFDKNDIYLLNVSQKGFLILFPLLSLLITLKGGVLCLRLIGGRYSLLHSKIPKPLRFIFNRFLAKCPVIFCEVIDNFKYFNDYGNCVLIPNSRKKFSSKNGSLIKSRINRKIMFASQVKKDKGILTYIEADPVLADLNIELDIYGPIIDSDLIQKIEKCNNVTYKGNLENSEVQNMMSQYDFVILISSHIGEGYPGILIESLNTGTPILINEWKFLPELLSPQRNGYLIRNLPEDLINIYQNLTKEKLAIMSENAEKSFERFDIQKNYSTLKKEIENLLN